MNQREGAAAFTLPMEKRVATSKCDKLLQPYGASLTEAVQYYVKHVLVYRQAPTAREIVNKLIEDKERGNRRPSTILELKHRLGRFAEQFGDRRLGEISGDGLHLGCNKLLAPRCPSAITARS